MRLQMIAVAVTAIAAASPALAQKDSYVVASELAEVLSSEEACGFTLKGEAIRAYVETNVDQADMGFMSTLRLRMEGVKYQLDSMPASLKTAHCIQARRAAKHYGMID